MAEHEMPDQVGHDEKGMTEEIIMEKKGYIYFMTNVSNSVLYVGVTNSLKRRVSEHAEGGGSVFTHKYNCTKLVYFETFPDVEQAIVREKQIKHFKRVWKDELVNSVNPEWRNLADEIFADPDVI